MRERRCAQLALRICLVFLTFVGTGQRILAESGIHFRLVHNTLIVVSLLSDQKESIDFVFDTGADTTVIDPSILPRLLFVPLGRIQQTTLSGVQLVPRGLIRSLSVGSMRVDDVPVLVQDLTELRKLDPQIEGIAGQNFIAHFNYLIDYRKHLLGIEQDHEIRDAIDGVHVSIEAAENRMFVVADGHAFGRAKLNLLLDSGADSVVLLPWRPGRSVFPNKDRTRVDQQWACGIEIGTDLRTSRSVRCGYAIFLRSCPPLNLMSKSATEYSRPCYFKLFMSTTTRDSRYSIQESNDDVAAAAGARRRESSSSDSAI